jgi:hypothetical protein
VGDYINFGTNPAVREMMNETGERRILFADNVMKLNRRFKSQERVIMVTERVSFILHLRAMVFMSPQSTAQKVLTSFFFLHRMDRHSTICT